MIRIEKRFLIPRVFLSATKTKHHKLSGLNNKNLFLTVLETGKSKIKVRINSVSGDRLLPGLQMTIFPLYPHMTESRKRSTNFYKAFYKGTNPIMRGITS